MHPKTYTKFGSNNSNIITTSIDIIKSNVIDEPILFLASSFLPSPSLKLRFAAAPLPTRPANALHIITIGNITFVAAFPIIPTPLPINI